jgi:hypothetical protein
MFEDAQGSTMGTLRHFMSKVKGYIYQEEVIKALGKTDKPQSPSSEIKKEGESSSRKRKKTTSTHKRQNQRLDQKWTPLNASLSIVFMEIRKDPSFKRLPKMRTSPTKCNNQKYYEYHHDHGHWTEDCVILKEVEMFIQGGKLTKFVDKEERIRNYIWDNQPQETKSWGKLTTLEILKGLTSINEDHRCINKRKIRGTDPVETFFFRLNSCIQKFCV